MALSESAILTEAQKLVRFDADESEMDVSFVRSAFEELALEVPLFESESTINLVALQREYDLGRIYLVYEVRLDGQLLPRREPTQYAHQSWYQRGGKLCLNWEPGSAGTLLVRGWYVPSSINGLTVEPENSVVRLIALRAASNFLSSYGDGRASHRVNLYEMQAARIKSQLKRRLLNRPIERGETTTVPRRIGLI